MWIDLECKQCGYAGEHDMAVLREYGGLWECYRCGTEQPYRKPVERRGRSRGRRYSLADMKAIDAIVIQK